MNQTTPHGLTRNLSVHFQSVVLVVVSILVAIACFMCAAHCCYDADDDHTPSAEQNPNDENAIPVGDNQDIENHCTESQPPVTPVTTSRL